MNTINIAVKRTIMRLLEDKLDVVVCRGDDLRSHMDSLDIIEFLMVLEEHYDIEIDDTTAMQWLRIEDVINYIEERLK